MIFQLQNQNIYYKISMSASSRLTINDKGYLRLNVSVYMHEENIHVKQLCVCT